MIDVNKITSTLAKLPDAQLQQYAQMHKSDPYIMALAMTESNRRKEMRSAGQGAQGVQEMPKVVDQAVAEMAPQQLPEELGIGQLPAGDMNFADGGIVAFADGGDVERYQVGGMMGDIPGFVAGTGNFMPQQGAPEEVPLLRRLFRDARATGQSYQVEQAKARIAAGVGTSADQAILAAASGTQNAGPSPQDMAQFDAASNLYMTERAASQAMPKASDAAPKPASTPVPTTRAAAAPSATSVAAPSYAGLDPAAMFRKEMEAAGKQPNPQAKELEELGKMKVSAKEEEATGLEAIQKKYNDIFKGRKERMETKEAEIAKMGDQSLGLALLQAGAAMMTTPGGLGAALGKGVEVGSKQYMAGLDKLNAAKDKLSDARDRLEEVEAQRGEMSARELFKARNEIKNTQIGAKEDMVKALMQRDNINRETALKMVDNQIKIGISQLEQQGQTARTNAQIAAGGRNNQLELLEAVSRDPKLAAAYQSMHGKGEDVMGQFNDYVKANPTLAADPKQAFSQFLMTKAAFQQLGRPTVTEKPTGPLRTQ